MALIRRYNTIKPIRDVKRAGMGRRRTTSESQAGKVPIPNTIEARVTTCISFEELSVLQHTDSLDELESKLKPYPSTNLRDFNKNVIFEDTDIVEIAADADVESVSDTNDNEQEPRPDTNDGPVSFKHAEHGQHACRLFAKDGNNREQKATFRDACDITYPADRHPIVTDMVGSKIYRFAPTGEFLAAFSGAEIVEPWATCVTSQGQIVFTSRRRKSVTVMSQEGKILWAFGCGFFKSPSGICITRNERFIVTDSVTNRVSLHTREGRFIQYAGNSEIKEQRMSSPRYVCVSPFGEILVSDSGNHAIKMFDSDGHFIRSFGAFGKGDGELKTPYGLCCDNLGNVLVADHYNNRVSMFSRNGDFICHVLTHEHGICHPKGLALTPDNHLFVTHGSLKGNEVKMIKLRCSNQSFVLHL